jgi:hypothetical protein
MSCCYSLTSAEKAQSQVIESQAVNLIQELITARQGKLVSNPIEIATIAYTVLHNLTTLENINIKSIPLNEKISILVDVIQKIYPELVQAGLVSQTLQTDIQIFVQDLTLWEPIIETALALYDTIAQVSGLPSFQQVGIKVEGFLGNLKVELKAKYPLEKIKIKKFLVPPKISNPVEPIEIKEPVPQEEPKKRPLPKEGPLHYKPA